VQARTGKQLCRCNVCKCALLLLTRARKGKQSCCCIVCEFAPLLLTSARTPKCCAMRNPRSTWWHQQRLGVPADAACRRCSRRACVVVSQPPLLEGDLAHQRPDDLIFPSDPVRAALHVAKPLTSRPTASTRAEPSCPLDHPAVHTTRNLPQHSAAELQQSARECASTRRRHATRLRLQAPPTHSVRCT
jgi:hypothetical protein